MEHRNRFFWHQRTPDVHRPLITDRLHRLAEERLKRLRDRNADGTLAPPSWDQLEKLGKEIGAREPEIWAVLERYGVLQESGEIDPDAVPAWALR